VLAAEEERLPQHTQGIRTIRAHETLEVRAHLRGSDMHRKLVRELLSAPGLVSCVQP
jgi:hypothetical protein